MSTNPCFRPLSAQNPRTVGKFGKLPLPFQHNLDIFTPTSKDWGVAKR